MQISINHNTKERNDEIYFVHVSNVVGTKYTKNPSFGFSWRHCSAHLELRPTVAFLGKQIAFLGQHYTEEILMSSYILCTYMVCIIYFMPLFSSILYILACWRGLTVDRDEDDSSVVWCLFVCVYVCYAYLVGIWIFTPIFLTLWIYLLLNITVFYFRSEVYPPYGLLILIRTSKLSHYLFL